MWRWQKLRTTTGEQTSPGLVSRLQTRCVCVFNPDFKSGLSFTPPTLSDQAFHDALESSGLSVFLSFSCRHVDVHWLPDLAGTQLGLTGGLYILSTGGHPKRAERVQEHRDGSARLEQTLNQVGIQMCMFSCVLPTCAILGCSVLNLALLAQLESTGRPKIDGIASDGGRGRLSLWELTRSRNAEMATRLWLNVLKASLFGSRTSDPERTGAHVSSSSMHRVPLLL